MLLVHSRYPTASHVCVIPFSFCTAHNRTPWPSCSACGAICILGGDGTLHEAIQGLLTRPDWPTARKIPLAVIPAGSGNAMATSLGLEDPVDATLALVRGHCAPLDVFSSYALSSGPSPSWHFLRFGAISFTSAMIARADLGTDALRFLGDLRFTLGILSDILMARRSRMDVAFFCGPPAPPHAQSPRPEPLSQAGRESVHDALGSSARTVPTAVGLRGLDAVLEGMADAGARVGGKGGEVGVAGWGVEEQKEFQMWGVYNVPWIASDFEACPGQEPWSGDLRATFSAAGVSRWALLGLLATSIQGGDVTQHRAFRGCSFTGALVAPRKAGEVLSCPPAGAQTRGEKDGGSALMLPPAELRRGRWQGVHVSRRGGHRGGNHVPRGPPGFMHDHLPTKVAEACTE